MYNFQLVNCDTDSITVCKKDGSPFSDEEQDKLLRELNSVFPPAIKWEDDGYFKTVIVVKAKNYVLWDGKKIKYKGSALKATMKEPALQEFIKRTLDIILNTLDTTEMNNKIVDLYKNYAKEVMNVQDITRWASKKTITDKILKNERSNEAKVRDALDGSDYVEGDKIFVYFKEDGTLNLVENFSNDHDKKKLLGKLYKTSNTFETIIPKELFTNYSLVKHYKIIDQIL
jgi:hypothetical protein